VPAARPEGLGAAVAGTVPPRAAYGAGALCLLGCAAAGLGEGVGAALRIGAAVLVGAAGSALLLRHCVRRFGGVTGDVFGALEETAATAALVVLALGR
jgi:adenosylcobinamide-GDP ribazoletransferase